MMGLLNDFLSTVDNAKRNLSTNFFDAITNPKEWGNMMASRMRENMYGGPEEAAAMKGYLSRQPYDTQAYARANDTLTNNAINESLGAVTVWHGSPHKFNKFDMSKIGTGEGAQAYGHGLYFAESPDVAETYFGNFKNDAQIQQLKIRSALPRMQAENEYLNKVLSGDEPMPVFSSGLPAGEKYIRDRMDSNLKDLASANEWLNKHTPSLYKVDIPDEAVSRFLDWDKPLSQQAPEVQKALKKSQFYKDARARYKETGQWYDDPSQKTGEGLLKYLRSGTTDVAGGANQYGMAEDYLKSQGIQGIRYLDGGSRGQQAGTSNFVLFDDQMPRILEINGTPTGLQPWKPGEWRGLLGE